MNIFGFQKRLFVFGGRNSSGTGFNEFRCLNLVTNSWEESRGYDYEQSKNILNSIDASVTIVPCESPGKCNVYIIGGKYCNIYYNDRFNVLEKGIVKFSVKDIFKWGFWLLHFLKATRFNRMMSINMHEDMV